MAARCTRRTARRCLRRAAGRSPERIWCSGPGRPPGNSRIAVAWLAGNLSPAVAPQVYAPL
jgi:hypothetical protein